MTALSIAIRPVAAVNDLVERIAWSAGTVLLAAMTVSILLQVFFRYVLGDSLTWTAEAGRFMMVWLAFIMAPVTVRCGANVGIALITANVRGRPRIFLDIAITALVMAMLALLFSQSMDLIERGQGVRSTSLRLPMSYFYMIVPISLGAMFLVGVELVLRALQGLGDPKSYRSPMGSPEDEELNQPGAEETGEAGGDDNGQDDGGRP